MVCHFGLEVDLFSAGCLLFYLLTGEFLQLRNWRDVEGLGHNLNSETCDFICQLTDLNRDRRPSAEDALNHQFFFPKQNGFMVFCRPLSCTWKSSLFTTLVYLIRSLVMKETMA